MLENCIPEGYLFREIDKEIDLIRYTNLSESFIAWAMTTQE